MRFKRWFLKRYQWGLIFFGGAIIVAMGNWWRTQPTEQSETAVYPGITYTCRRFEEPEIQGLAHLITIDLRTPHLSLYVTPPDPVANALGYDSYTVWVPSVVKRENLAVAINGTLFERAGLPMAIWPGQLALSSETIVSDYRVNLTDPNSYLLWFEEDLSPHLENMKPPSTEVLQKSKWGISGQAVYIKDGRVRLIGESSSRDTRTMIGIDQVKKLLFLGVFESASEQRAAEVFAIYGVRDAIAVDSGSSSCIALGDDARNISRATLVYPQRAVANVFGVGFKKESK